MFCVGDAQYKPCVTARPEITVVDLDGDEDFVVVACDGLWDVVSEDAVALSVYNQLMNDPSKCFVYFFIYFCSTRSGNGSVINPIRK